MQRRYSKWFNPAKQHYPNAYLLYVILLIGTTMAVRLGHTATILHKPVCPLMRLVCVSANCFITLLEITVFHVFLLTTLYQYLNTCEFPDTAFVKHFYIFGI